MGLFTRASDIVHANLNAMLDKAEDPHKMLRLTAEEIEEAIDEARQVSARHISACKQSQREQQQHQRAADRWEQKARLAVAADDDAKARHALARKHACDASISQLQQNLTQHEETLARLEQDISRLQQIRGEAQRRLARPQPQNSARSAAGITINSPSPSANAAELDRMQQNIEQLHTRLNRYTASDSANQTVAEAFKTLQRDEAVETELTQLKQQRADVSA
ncbi:PspA/IM30 family protein [Salinimonas marina]|uniref:PspA/IM30 family protein n=1 Tax=Salinimonas marina TaxID=2785918 RepID=A0A7S9DZA1_9ALTE|nr:PspA/IM30 family protein [Salinimonas marina]QPG06100.1 PspA/IM30 family protein [Salinimonas marina]